MAVYTSSPLGLIFDSQINTYDISNGVSVDSIFSSKNKFIIQKTSSGKISNPLTFEPPSSIQQDEVYDIRTSNILRILSDIPSMKLKASDFAYCKYNGVYPNNRLIVCRRFDNPIGDDLTESEAIPNSSIVSWFMDDNPMLEFSFNENWTESDVSFKNVLNQVGGDIGLKKIGIELGDALSAASNLVPLPGVTEGLQRKILEKLGLVSPESANIIPSGEPNLIKQAKVRSLIGADESGSGLNGKFSIKVRCVWEQKFISRVDPTLVYYDILRNVLSFGSSDAVFYLGKKSNLSNLKDLLKKLENGALDVVTDFIDGLTNSIKDIVQRVKEGLQSFKNAVGSATDEAAAKSDDKSLTSPVDVLENQSVLDYLNGLLSSFKDTIIRKYKVPLLGIVSSLTGLPSTPWHVTIGNPLRPIFSSGDMLCKDVSVKLGSQLAFNDLPSFIECELTLESARNLGADEIFSKLSGGALRVSEGPVNYWNSDFIKDEPIVKQPTPSSPPSENKEEDVIQPLLAEDVTKVGNDPTENGTLINPDPNSSQPTNEVPQTNYVVKPGDSMWKIAKNSLGPNATNSEINAKMKDIIAKNKNKNPLEADGIVNSGQNSDPDFISPGDTLLV